MTLLRHPYADRRSSRGSSPRRTTGGRGPEHGHGHGHGHGHSRVSRGSGRQAHGRTLRSPTAVRYRARQPSGELTRHGRAGIGVAPPSADGGGRALTFSRRSRRGRCTVSGCRPPVSASTPGPARAGREASLSLAEANRAAQSRGVDIQICGLGGQRRCWPPAPHWGRHTGGMRANPAGCGQTRRSAPGEARAGRDRAEGGARSPAGATALRGGRSVPSAATCSSFQGRRGPGPRRRRRERVALPAPSQRTQASRKRAGTELMRLSSQSPIHRDCLLSSSSGGNREKRNEVVY